MKRSAVCLLAMLLVAAAPPPQAAPTSADVPIHVIDNGRVSEPAIIFIPGWGMTADVWRKQIAHFDKDWRVIAVDPRGQGRSGGSDTDVSPEARARDLAALLDRLKIEKAVLVGWSLGVQDVAAYLEAYGAGRVTSVVLVDAIPSSGPASAAADPALAANLSMMQLFLTAPNAYANGMLAAIFMQPVPDADRVNFLNGMRTMSPASGAASMMSGLYGRNRAKAFEDVCLPVMVVAADGPDAARFQTFAQSLLAARFRTVPGAGHALFFDQPAAFNAILESFFSETPRADCLKSPA